MTTYRYDNGLTFSIRLAIMLKDFRIRLLRQKPTIIIVDGFLGEGKTTLMIHVMDYINHIFGFPEVDIRGCQFSMGGIEFLRNLRLCYQRGFKVIGYTEAGDFNRRGSLTQFNAMLNRVFETFRAFNIIVVLDLPTFMSLDNSIFDKGSVRLLLHCEDRTQNQGHFKAYCPYEISLLRNNMMKTTFKSFVYKNIKPSFQGHFLNLSPNRCKILDEISTKGKKNIIEKSGLKLEGLVTQKDIADRLSRSKVWVRHTLSKLKVNHFEIRDQTKFYKDTVIDILNDNMAPTGRPRKR